MAPLPELLTTSQVAERLAVDPDTVRRWVRKGLLKAIVLPSKQLRFRPEDVAASVSDAEPAEQSA